MATSSGVFAPNTRISVPPLPVGAQTQCSLLPTSMTATIGRILGNPVPPSFLASDSGGWLFPLFDSFRFLDLLFRFISAHTGNHLNAKARLAKCRILIYGSVFGDLANVQTPAEPC